MKSIIRLLAVVSFPVAVMVLVGLLSFILHVITNASFDEVSTNLVTWVVSVITVTVGYIYANAD